MKILALLACRNDSDLISAEQGARVVADYADSLQPVLGVVVPVLSLLLLCVWLDRKRCRGLV